jgi:holo-[acyl-carrier protein] synthase
MIVGHGVDIVSIERIAESLDRFGDRFLERCFTEDERAYAMSTKTPAQHLAARFAAKEAAFKALGTGWRSGIAWTDVEVVRLPSGEPRLKLHGEASRVAAERGAVQWWLSLSHTKTEAVASVIAARAVD